VSTRKNEKDIKQLQRNDQNFEQKRKKAAGQTKAGKRGVVNSGGRNRRKPQAIHIESDEVSTVQEILKGLEDEAITPPPFESIELSMNEEITSTTTTKPRIPHSHGASPGKYVQTSASLPLPPFLRPTPRLRDRPFTNLNYTSVARLDRSHKLKDSLKIAPFSTAFLQNPYAHALATPVRQCGFTNLRLPSSCLLDFHLTESTSSSSSTNAKDAGNTNKLALSPLSLTAALIPRNKASRNRTPAERTVLRAAERAELRPVGLLGSASYVTNQRAALLFTSPQNIGRPQDIAKRTQALVRQFVAGRRTLAVLSSENPHGAVEWRGDMADVVLRGLRSVVIKKLRFFLAAKIGARDKSGLVAEVPGGARERLDDVEGVVAVLRLRRSKREDEEPLKDNQDHEIRTNEARVANVQEAYETSPQPQFPPQPLTSVTNTNTNTTPSTSPSTTPNTNPPPSKTSATHIHHTGHWHATQPAHLQNLLPLPPPAKPSTLYFPTLRYRNQRVALYNLAELLGEDGVAELVKGTVFEWVEHRGMDGKMDGGNEEEEEKGKQCEWITVRAHRATAGALGWCLKLAAYVAGRKSGRGSNGEVL